MNGALASGPVTLAVVAFGLLTAWCFTNRRVDLTLAALGLYLGLLDGYIKLSTGSPFATLGRDVLVVAIAGGALARSSRTGKPLPIPPLGGLVLAFSALVLVEFVNPLGERSLASGFAGIRQHLEFVPLFFLGYTFVRRESQLQKLMLILVVCAAIGGVVSLVQSTLTPEQFASWGPGYTERVLGTGNFAGAPRVAYSDDGQTGVRPFGLGSDIGGGAVLAALALPSLLALMLGAGPGLRLASIPLGLGIALAVATSGTRAAIITVAVSLMAFVLLAVASRNVGRVLVGSLVGLGLVFGVFTVLGPDTTTAERSQSIRPDRVVSSFSEERGSSVRLFGDYAVQYPLGLGIGSAGPAALAFRSSNLSTEQLNTETEWNFLVLELGLAGVIIFLAINLRTIGLAFVRIRRIAQPTLRLQLAALAAPLVGLLAASFAAPTTSSVPPAPYIWFVIGVLSFWLITAYESPGGAVSAQKTTKLPNKPTRVRGRREDEAHDRSLEPATR